MKILLVAALSLTPLLANAALKTSAWPGCDIKAQRAVKGETGGAITDPGQAHILWRVNVLQADIGNARKARALTQPHADKLWRRLERIRQDTNALVKKKGFLSTPQRAGYDRELNEVAEELCH